MKKSFYIGIDGGGTQTRALLADESGHVWGCGHGGSANRNHYERAQVREILQAVLRDALFGMHPECVLSTLFLGLGGVSTEEDRRDIGEIVREIPEAVQAEKIIIDNDTIAGLTGGLAGRAGLILIAGTGSACFGINGEGKEWLCGGWGAVADDVGSAPWVGQRAIHASVRAEDGRDAPTRLQSLVFEFLGLSNPRDLISRIHNHGLSRADLGRLAPLVANACRQGDAVAEAILREGACGLSEMVRATAGHLFGGASCELALVGGLALSGPPFQTMLTEQICRDYAGITVRAPELSPVQGAVLEALRAGGVAWTPEVLSNLSSHVCESEISSATINGTNKRLRTTS